MNIYTNIYNSVMHISIEWDNGNWPKCGKHGLTQEEIEFVLNSDPILFTDTEHSQQEERFKAIGKNQDGRYVFIVFTVRFSSNREVQFRPISGRYMHQKEIDHYEQ